MNWKAISLTVAALLFCAMNPVWGQATSTTNTTSVLSAPPLVLSPSGLNSSSFFGFPMKANNYSIALGAPGAYSLEGAVFIYACPNATSCSLTQTLGNPDPSVGLGFGSALGFSDYFLAVGVPSMNSDVGGVYVFSCNGSSTCTPLMLLQPSIGTAGGHFGTTIAVDGLYILVGAPGVGPNGAAYLYDCSSMTSCILASFLTPNTTSNNSSSSGNNNNNNNNKNNSNAKRFGFSLRMNNLLAAIVSNSGGTSNSSGSGNNNNNRGRTGGAVFVFDCANPYSCNKISTFAQNSVTGESNNYNNKVNSSSNVIGARYGTGLEVYNNYIFVGANGLNGDQGGVFIYQCNRTNNNNNNNNNNKNKNCSLISTLIVNNEGNGPEAPRIEFGTSIAVYGNLLVIGAQTYKESGTAFIYTCTNASSSCILTAYLTLPNAVFGEHFGKFVAMNQGLIAISAPYANNSVGEAFVYTPYTTTGMPSATYIPRVSTNN